MYKFFKPYNLLLYFLAIVLFFVIGAFFASMVGLAKNQGLAGGAIVFFYGVVFAFIAFIISLMVAARMERTTIIRINKFLGVLVICLSFVMFWRIQLQIKNRQDRSIQTVPKHQETVPQ